MQLVLKGVGVAGATPLGIAGDWSYLQEDEDRVFYSPHLHDLQPGTQLVSYLCFVPCLLSYCLILPAPKLLWRAGWWGRRGMSAPQVCFPRPTASEVSVGF